MQLTSSTKRQTKPKPFVIVCKTARQFFEAMHKIEAGGWRWWRISQKLPGPEKHIETNMPQDTNDI